MANNNWYRPLCLGFGVTTSFWSITGEVLNDRLYILALCAQVLRSITNACIHEESILLEGEAEFPFLDVYL